MDQLEAIHERIIIIALNPICMELNQEIIVYPCTRNWRKS